MSNHLQEDGSFINSIVGEGTSFRGNLELNGLLRIDGDFSGTIRTQGKVLVGINGRAECTIHAGTVVIGGVVKGNVQATEKVLVLSTGMMIGNISTPRLIAEEGVVLDGTCLVQRAGESSGEPTTAPTANTVGEVAETEQTDETRPSAPDNDSEPSDETAATDARIYSGATDGGSGTWNG